MSDDVKLRVINNHIEKFPLGTTGYEDVVRDYMNAVPNKKKRHTESVVNTLNNAWKRQVLGMNKIAVYGNTQIHGRKRR